MQHVHHLSRFIQGRFFFALITAVLALALGPVSSPAQFKFRQPPNRQDPASLGEREGQFVWQQFLHNRGFGSFQLQGRLVYRPALAESRSFGFLLSGDWSGGRECSTLTLTHPDGRASEARVVVIGGKAYKEGQPGALLPVGDAELNSPLFADLPFTWADLVMPFLYWSEPAYEGPDRYLGRPAHEYALTNPEAGASPAKAVVTLDEDYAALLKAVLYDSDGTLAKRIRVGGFKQFGDQWLFSSLFWEHRPTRSSVRLDVDAFSLVP